MEYRQAIDGLRALAVLPVMLFHANIQGFGGGFVGVDIFFVISGYLITSIILHQQQQGNFTLANFYERRMRRILPALFIVIFATLPAAWFWLLPHELTSFGESLIAVSLFMSNILFWRDSDYFAADSELIPLLHTWSLAVEEQFYLFYPFLLILLVGWAFKPRVRLLGIIALFSLLIAEWGWRQEAAANFYLIFGRIWELLAGALCAHYLIYQPNTFKTSSSLQQVLGLTGLGLIVASIYFLDKSLPFPSFYTVFPVLGAMLIILFAWPGSFVNTVLSLKPLVGIGLISYSAYLWHQPLFAFARISQLEPPSSLLMMGLLLAALVLATLSWYWIEQPLRKSHILNRRRVFYAAATGSILLIITGIILIIGEGFPSRFME